MESADQRMTRLLEQLKQDPSLVDHLPSREAAIVRQALTGQDVYQIAQHFGMSEGAVWELLGNVARSATHQPLQTVESGGLGSDTDPGVTGGYGETGFGSLANEPPEPLPEEPTETR